MAVSTSSGSGDYGLFDELAEEFAERYRRGERPSLHEYIDRCPEMGDEIRELFPALVEVEQAEEVLEPHHEPAASPSAPALRQVGDYRVIREVGRGGMGVVYEAEQVSLGRRVALKILPGVVAKDRKAVERFRREARAAARLHHTNIVPVFEVGRDGEVVFYAMQFIQGQGLDVVIDELAHRRRNSGHGSAAPVVARAEEPWAGQPGTTQPERTGAVSRSLASVPVRDRTEALVVSLRARQVSRVARSLVTGTFAAEAIDPDRTGSSSGVLATDARDGQATGASVRSLTGPESSISSASSSAVLPGGTQVSAVESSGRRLPFFRSVAQIGRQAAQGLAYAHARGIIHRDIKPSNLLLDTAGVVWIADFGLAKADDDGLTATGDILGTIRYMAPERFRGEGDARADVYALGLTLYELLTLRPGFQPSDRLQMIERIKTEEPVRPRTVDSRIPRDLETIVLKTIDKDPDRRYPTADAMAEDLRRYLDDEPVLARRTTAVERYARWARRNPWVAGLGAVLTGVLVLATAASLAVAGRMALLAERQQRAAESERGARLEAQASQRQAESNRRLADEARGAAVAALKEADTQRVRAETNLKEADAEQRRAEDNFQRARAAVDQYFTQVSESQLLSVPGLQTLRKELLGSALAFYEDFLKSRGQDPSLRSALAAVQLKAANIHIELGQPAEAEKAFRNASALYESISRANPRDVDARSGLAECYLGLGEHGNDPARRREDLLRSVAIREDLAAARAGDTRLREELARSYQALGDSDLATRDHRKALVAFLKARDIEATLIRDQPDSPAYQHDFARNLGQIALCLCGVGRHQDETVVRPLAIEHARTAFEQSPQVVAYGRLYGRLLAKDGDNLFSQDRPDDGARAFRQAVSVQLRLIRENPAVPDLPGDLVETCDSVVSIMVRGKRAPGALALLREAIDALEALPRDEPNPLFGLAQLLVLFAKSPELSGKPDAELERRHQNEERAVAALRRAIAAGFRDLKAVQSSELLEKFRERDDVKDLMTEMAQAPGVGPSPGGGSDAPRTGNPADPASRSSHLPDARIRRYQAELATSQHAIGLIQLGLGDLDEAVKSLSQALSLRESLDKGDPGTATILRQLAQIHLAKGENDRALDLFNRAVALTPDDPLAFALRGQFLGQLGRVSQAEADFSRAVLLKPDDPRVWKLRGLSYATRGLPDEAATAFAKLMELTPESQQAATMMGLAELIQKAGRLDQARQCWGKALPLLTQAVERRPDDRQAWKDLGIVHAELAQPEAATTAFAKLMELVPESDSKNLDLWWSPDPAGIGEALGPYDEIFTRVVRARSRDRTLLIARFHYLGRRHRWRDAAEMVARIIELDPKDNYARGYHRALLLFTGDVQGYRRACREAVAARGEVNAIVGGWDQLLGQFEFPRAVEIGPLPLGPDARLGRAIAAYRGGQYVSTIRELAGVLDSTRHPYRLTLAHLFMAMAHQRLGQVAEARQELDAARKLLDGLGRVFWHGPRDPTDSELMDYGWTEWLHARILLDEAEALILYDPIFPADPFAR